MLVKNNIVTLLAFFILAFLATGQSASAASLFISPASGSYPVGGNFSVSVYVASASQAMNAASGTISFPADKLRIVSVSKSGSIMNLWTQEPSFSNASGTAQFEGVVLSPGFTGSAGKLVTYQFSALAPGPATLKFTSSAVLANDGEGTDILTGSNSATFSLVKSPLLIPIPIPPPADIAVPLGSIKIASPTHPDSNSWYSNNNPRFVWIAPKDVDMTRILYDKYPTTNPTILYPEAISDKQLTGIPEGVWYFHVQMHNASGWSGVSHFKFQIDTQKPEHFEMKEIANIDTTEPTVKFLFDGDDKTSGIDRYQIQIDGRESGVWRDAGSHIYETSFVDPGRHTIIAQAIDRAGNALSASSEFSVDPLEMPVFTSWSKNLKEGDNLITSGASKYVNSNVEVWSQMNDEHETSSIVVTDFLGRFTFADGQPAKSGVYTLWARALDSRGAKSYPTEKIVIMVSPLTLFQRVLAFLGWFKMILPLTLLIFSMLCLICLLCRAIIHIINKNNNHGKK